MKGLWFGMVAAACIAACAPALAADFDVTAGPSVTSGERSTFAMFASMFGTAPDNGKFSFEPIGSIGWIAPHHTRREDLHRNVFIAAGGLRITAPGRHWFASEQLAATSIRTDALSSRLEFMTSAGWQDGHFVMMVRHISNGRLIGGGKNLGETMLLAGIRW